MDIPMNVKVLCETKECGQSSALVVNPVTEQVTHIVVTENKYPYTKRLVPVEKILESTPRSIHLRCNRDELSDFESFEDIEFINPKISEVDLNYDVPFVVWPYSLVEEDPIEVTHEHIPAGEIAIHRKAFVHAEDGIVGKVDEFLVSPNNNHITHLVLREGHLWGKKDVTIPVSEIEKITEDAVYLKLDKKAIEKLPAIPVKRLWL